MKLMLLGAGSVIHTQRWANGLVAAGVDVVCVSQHDFLPQGWDERVQRLRLPHRGAAAYLRNAATVRRWFAAHRCAVLNAHYATGYGTLATLSGVRPRVVSVWGSDVYDFPQTSALHRWLVQRVLRGADRVASTSAAMAQQVLKVVGGRGLNQAVAVIPFGVDSALFSPAAGAAAAAAAGPAAALVVGTVKTLAPKYGIDTLLQAFARLPPAMAGHALRLRIVGDGPERHALHQLARELAIESRVDWVGAVPHAQVPSQLRQLDLYVAASRLDSESFGVAVIEASACALPVVVTRVGGLPEVVAEGETGLVVERENPQALAAALQRLLADAGLRRRLGLAGRSRVQSLYEWAPAVGRMVALFGQVVGGSAAAPTAVEARPAEAAASASASNAGSGTVSVIVPCRNERDHIDPFMRSVLAQQLAPGLQLQVVVADGASDDGTRDRLADWAAREPRLLVVDNPQRITSAALNRAIAASGGHWVVRMDVHTEYAPDYIAQCVQALADTGATCVGGAWRPVGQGGRQGAIALAFQSRFGSGGAASRRVDLTGPVDTVYLGAWQRTELLRVGGFDEALVRNQDDELNLRILRAGGSVWQSAAIRSWYTPRASYLALFRQFYQYGYWKVPVIRKHRLPASPRHLVPFAFVMLLAVLVLLGWFSAVARWSLLGVVSAYAAAAFYSALRLAPRRAPRLILGVAWAFACMHAGYGLGFGRGLLDIALLRRTPGVAVTRLTR